jgi:hypothetical protein
MAGQNRKASPSRLKSVAAGDRSCHMAERTTVRLPPDLIRRAKLKAAEDGRSLTSLIEEGLRRVVDESRTEKPVTRILPRVSAAKGGLAPGIEWDRLAAAVQEMDDLDYVRRFF